MLVLRSLAFNILFYANLVLWLIFAVLPALLLPKQALLAVETARVPVIVTLRPTWEGGFSQKSDAERLALWEAAMEAGAEYVDIELVSWEKSRPIRDMVQDVAEKHGTRLIISNHCFEGRPADFDDRLRRLLAVTEADVLKLAWKAETLLDGIRALHFQHRDDSVPHLTDGFPRATN